MCTRSISHMSLSGSKAFDWKALRDSFNCAVEV
jgi:hypothetical protein